MLNRGGKYQFEHLQMVLGWFMRTIKKKLFAGKFVVVTFHSAITLLFMTAGGQAWSQTTKVLANTVTYTSPNSMSSLLGCGLGLLSPCYNKVTVLNPSNAIVDNESYARLLASPGSLLGLGSYSGGIELQFPTSPPNTNLPANTVSYVRINGDSGLLNMLLGGSLGNLLGEAIDLILLGRQGIEIQARNSSGTQVLSRTSSEGFNTAEVRLVQDSQGAYYLMIKPDQPYDKIRIISSSISALGLGSEYTLDVYNAFYYEPDPCDVEPAYTSFDGSGTSLSVLQLNQLVVEPNSAIDNNASTSSTISLGVVGLLASTEQLVYFNTPVVPGNEILISLGIEGGSLVDLDLFESIEFNLYSSDGLERTVLASDLLGLDLLGLFNSGESYGFPISVKEDDPAIIGIGVNISSLVSAGLLDVNLKFSEVTVAPIRPEVETVPEEGEFVICEGEIVNVTPVNEAGGELNWYQIDGSSEISLGTADTYSTEVDLAPGDYEFLVRSTTASCTKESEPSRFRVKVNPIPNPANYNIQPSGELGVDAEGKYTYMEGVNPITLTPTMPVDWTGEGDFVWFLDEDMTIQILDGIVLDDVLYELEDANLTMTGLKFRDETDPYKFFLNWVPDEGCGSDVPLELDLSSFARILNVSLSSFIAEEWTRGQVKLDWKLSGLNGNKTIKLERAGPDLKFIELASFSVNQNFNYSYIDSNPLRGNNYYRLKVIDEVYQNSFISQLLRVQIASFPEKSFRIFPNDFENEITIIREMKGLSTATLILSSGKGSTLQVINFNFSELDNKVTLSDLGKYPPGNYLIQIMSEKGSESFHLIKK